MKHAQFFACRCKIETGPLAHTKKPEAEKSARVRAICTGVFAVRKVALVLVFVCLTMCGCAASGAEEDTLTAVFYDVGKADAILLYTEDAAVLVDAGVNKSGEDIVADLHARGIERLDALIITHFDKDHVGGAGQGH